jgi:hypothetical protein
MLDRPAAAFFNYQDDKALHQWLPIIGLAHCEAPADILHNHIWPAVIKAWGKKVPWIGSVSIGLKARNNFVVRTCLSSSPSQCTLCIQIHLHL